jgi:hypothetical protein
MSCELFSLRCRVLGRVLPMGSLCALAFAGATLTPRAASAQRYYVVYNEREPWAQFNVGIDGEGAIPLSVPSQYGNSLSGGGGFKIRLGEQFRFYNMRFIPEVGYGYDHLFATDDSGDAFAWDMHRIFAGARVGFGRILVPGFYAHVGYGWRVTGDPNVQDEEGVAFDAGVMLDVHIVPHFGFGAHAEYALIDAEPFVPHWLAIGVHADVVF